MITNTASQWGLPARLFHWIFVVLVATEVRIGFMMTAAYAPAQHDKSLMPRLYLISAAHHTIGFTVLALVAARLSWRFHSVTPDIPDAGRAMRMLAHSTHGFLYLLLILLPLSGWATLSVYGEFPIFFGSFEHMPAILPKRPFDDPYGYGYFAYIHKVCWITGAFLLVAHVGAALWHHFVKRDNVLMRMIASK